MIESGLTLVAPLTSCRPPRVCACPLRSDAFLASDTRTTSSRSRNTWKRELMPPALLPDRLVLVRHEPRATGRHCSPPQTKSLGDMTMPQSVSSMKNWYPVKIFAPIRLTRFPCSTFRHGFGEERLSLSASKTQMDGGAAVKSLFSIVTYAMPPHQPEHDIVCSLTLLYCATVLPRSAAAGRVLISSKYHGQATPRAASHPIY